MNKFIVIYGVDGTGKSTTVDTLVKRLPNAVNFDDEYAKYENPHKKEKEEILKNGTLEEQFLYYMRSNDFKSKLVRGLLRRGKTVVKDRWNLDIYGHHKHLGLTDDQIRKLKTRFQTIKPDISVLLTLDEEERVKRMTNRGELTQIESNFERAEFLKKYLYEQIDPLIGRGKGAIIETTNRTPEKVTEHIAQLVL